MQKTAPDLYAYLPKVLESLVDVVGTVGDKFTDLLNDFEEFCNIKYKSGGPLKPEAAWEAYNDECANQYSNLNGFYALLKQLLGTDL